MSANGNGASGKGAKARVSARTCPICGKPAAVATRPFCSRRCADIDLHRWLSGGYAVPTQEDADEDGEGRVPERLPGDTGDDSELH